MSETLIRTAIKDILNTVTGIGQVHDYERFTANPLTFLNLFKDDTTGKIFGWEITRSGSTITRVTMTNYKVLHHFVIKGYYGLQDLTASEKLFNAVIEAVVSKIINTTIADTQGVPVPQVNKIDARMFGDFFCHYAEIAFSVAEILQPDAESGIVDLVEINLKYYLQEPETAGNVEIGTTTGAAENKLIDSGQNFTTYVTVGMHVENTTDSTYATVETVDSDTQLTLTADIFISGEDYRIVLAHAEDTIDDLDA